MRARPAVALLIETSNAYARGLLEGIMAYVREHKPWSIYLPEQGRGAAPPAWLARWKGDGLIVRVDSEAETVTLGRALAGLLVPGVVVGLDGPLGAGKTRLVRAIAEAAGVDPAAISSPTFGLIHEYDGVLPIYQLHPEAEMYAICQRNEEKMKAVGDYFGVERRIMEFKDVLKDPNVDVVHINTPIPDHAWMSIAALKAGKHVMSTVPMATTVKECGEIVKLAEKTKLKYICLLYTSPSPRD